MALGRTSLNLSAQWDQYRYYLAWAGLVCVLIYMASQWRDIADMFQRRQARYGTLAATSVLVVLGILVAVNYIGKQQNKRWDLTENKQFSLSDQSRNVAREARCAGRDHGLHAAGRSAGQRQHVPRSAPGVRRHLESDQAGADRRRPRTRRSRRRTKCAPTARSSSATRAGPNASRPTQEQDVTNALIKVVSGQARTVYFTQGHGEKDPTSSEGERVHGRVGVAEARELHGREARAGAAGGRAGHRHDGRRRGSARRLPARRDRDRSRSTSRRPASSCSSSMRRGPTSRRCRT